MSLMYAGYNKNNGKGALIGNWVEEEALRNATGYSRRKVPDPHHSPDRATPEATYGRVMLHPSETDRISYETTQQAANNHGDGLIRIPTGPRSSLREADLVARARQIHEEEASKKRDALAKEMAENVSVTTVLSAFQAPDTAVLVAQTRVPRGRNGSRVVDPNLTDNLTRGQVDALDKIKLDVLQQTTHYTQGVAVTKYSHALTTGVGLDFAATSSDSMNPFSRSTAFTNEIRDPTKRHGEAMEQSSSHDVRLGMSVHQRSALQRLMHAFKEDTTRQKLVLDRLAQCVDNNYLTLVNFRTALTLDSHLGWLSKKEIIHIFMHFDVDHVGAIRYADFVAFCEDPNGHMVIWQ